MDVWSLRGLTSTWSNDLFAGTVHRKGTNWDLSDGLALLRPDSRQSDMRAGRRADTGTTLLEGAAAQAVQ